MKIPPGIATGQQLRLQNEGEAGAGGGPAGHLYVVVHVQEHEFFRRDGNQPVLRDAGQLHHPGARRRDHRADARRPGDGQDPRRDADRHDAAPARQGHARRERPRPRRSVRHRAGADAEEAHAKNSGTCSSSSRRRCRRKSSSRARPARNRTSATCSTASRTCSGRCYTRLSRSRALTASSCSLRRSITPPPLPKRAATLSPFSFVIHRRATRRGRRLPPHFPARWSRRAKSTTRTGRGGRRRISSRSPLAD